MSGKDSSMHIGLNAITMYPGAIGGMETYFRKLLHWLQKIDSTNKYTVIYNQGYAADLPLSNPAFSMKTYHYEKKSFNWYVRGVLRNTLNIDPVRTQFRQLGLDLIHHPFNVLNPVSSGIPSVLTINDIQHEYYPEFFAAGDLHKRRTLCKPSAEEAARIITISDFTRRCVIEKYGINAGKIEVVHIGCGEEYRPVDDSAGLALMRQKYGLDRPFLYYPAGSWPHKNHKTLLAALKLLKERRRFDGMLVLTGIAMRTHDTVLAEIENLGLGDMVKILGYLPYSELPYIYNLATLLVFPSLFEGFGIPLVEAMACGCPVVCSNVTSLPEVAGNAAVLFEPLSPEDIADKVWNVWVSASEQQRLCDAGWERVKAFSWEEIARKTLAVYESVNNSR
jgi:glycosyltransferase involved in cell wall biosynthesis